jgi:hypothetical protein
MTIVYYKDLEPEDTPWITICPNPGVNFAKLEALLAPNNSDDIFSDGDISSLDIQKWSQNSNQSIANILSETMISTWALKNQTVDADRYRQSISNCRLDEFNYPECEIFQGHVHIYCLISVLVLN